MDKQACIIAAGVWGGKRALLKSRDRNYTPQITLVRDLIEGCEIAYMRDDVTGWCEGMNEHGIGITNAALAVGIDEAEGKLVKVTGKTTRDGKRILKALACDNLEDAVESICEYMNGLKGHTFIATPDKVMCVEQTKEHECRVKDLNPEDLHVRTNHGHYHTDAGYTEGEDYVSSVIRREKALLTLRDLESPLDLGPSLMKGRMKDRNDPNNMVRDTNNMSTTSQMVMNLTDREVCFYAIPGKMDYEGIEDNLPEGYEPKIKIKVYGYRNGGKELVELSLKTGLRRKSVEPVRLAFRMNPKRIASRYLESSAHTKSVALMKFLSGVANRFNAGRHVYVVGGAVRNFLLGVPIKDIDVVVDSVSLGHDSEWFARKVVESIPVPTSLVTNQYGVVIITVKGEWLLDGINMKGEVIEIANARKESYEGAGGKGKGYKPTDVSPATIEEDVFRREFTFNCMTGDTLIPTEMGILRIDKIASRSEGDHQRIQLQVAGRDGPATAVGWQYSGFTDTLRVETSWGHYFTCTHHHPVLVLRGHDHVWVQADHLTPGDILCAPVRQVVRKIPLDIDLPDPISPKRGGLKEVQRPVKMTPELAFILGCLVAEGSNTYKRVSFSNGDPALISRYSECFHAVFGVMPSRNRVVQKGTVRTLNGVDFVANRDCFDTYADSKTVVGWLDYLGLYCDGARDGATASHYKVIPWSILEADEKCQWAFLAAYLEGDGSIRPDSGRMVFRSVSPHIRHQLQVLLGAHGILSKIDGEYVHVNAVDSATLWGKIQPWMVTKGFDYGTATFKSRNRYGIPAEYLSGFLSGRRVRSCGRAGVAYRNDDGEEVAVQGVGETLHNIQRFLYDAHNRGDFLTLLDGLQRISPTECAKFRGLLDLGYQYVEVTSVTDAGKQDVYDISMSKDVEPAFVANGVVVHNTLLWRMLDLANGPDKAEIIDLTGLGRQHLEEKLISTPVNPDKTFSDDPTRQLRILKFLLRYDLKISPDVVASVKRNAHKLKGMPWEAVANILVGDILKSPKAPLGIKIMRSLGMMDVIVEMVREVPPFAAYLTRELANGNHTVELLLELADLGIAGRVLDFLTPQERVVFQQNTSGWGNDEARKYLEALRKPKLDSLALIQEFNLQGRDRANLMPLARRALLSDPSLMNQDAKLNDRVREMLRGGVRMAGVRTADVPEKYKHIDFKPPQSVADAAEKGLEYRAKASPSNKGGLTPAQAAKQGIGSGVQRAVNLKNRDNISPDTIKQMTAFFSRHEKNKGVAPEHKGEPWNDKGNVAWLIWGGDPGRAWAEKVKKQMEAADEKAKKTAVQRVVTRHLRGAEHELRELTPATEHQSPVEIIESELTVLESLWSDVQAVLDTYSSVVPMPHVGRIAGADLALHSQTEVFAKCEHGMRHAERVVNMCRTQLQLQPGDADVSSFLRDAQMLYDRFSEGRATARELLSAMNQKIVPAALKGIVAEAMDAVKAVTRYPNSVTVKVHAHMVPVELNNGMVSAQVFDAYVTVYPLPRDEQPEYQQFVFTQCTLGDTSVYLTAVDRTNGNAPAKPVKVTDGATAAKKILAALKGWSGLV